MENSILKYIKINSISSPLKFIIALMVLVFNADVFAQQAQPVAAASSQSLIYNPLFMALIAIIVLLFFIIIGFTELLKGAAKYRRDNEKTSKSNNSKINSTTITLLFFSQSIFAQADASPLVQQAVNTYWGLGALLFYSLVLFILLELIIVWVLYDNSMDLLGVRDRREADRLAKAALKEPTLMDKLNASVPIEKEAEIMMDHDYDGIKELDNDLPPWWKYGFYLTIIFAFFYLGYYHITRSGKLQKAEYEEQIAQAKMELEEYKKKSSNLIDENNVTLLTDKSALESGKNIYMENCLACHGKNAEGGVGPNLTDDYWIHGGGIKDVFKSIKYGWPEKGMKSWEQDLGAKQIHEITSYIKSLVGSNPANAKEKQGDFYSEAGQIVSDTTLAKDSTILVKDTISKKQ